MDTKREEPDHLVLFLREPTLFIERCAKTINEENIGFGSSGLTYIVITAIQDRLVCSKTLAYTSQSLDDPQPQLLPLLILIHRDVLDVSHCPQTPQELLLHEHGPGTNHLIIRLGNDDDWKVHLAGFDVSICVYSSGSRAE